LFIFGYKKGCANVNQAGIKKKEAGEDAGRNDTNPQ